MKPLTTIAACACFALVGMSAVARAETIARYECSIIGAASQEPIGDQAGHNLVTWQFSCFAVDGLLKGAVYTASAYTDWNGPKGTWIFAGGVHRGVGGLAVSLATDGRGSVVMNDGKPIGAESSGTGEFKFASGAFAALSGKPFKFVGKPVGGPRFLLDLTD